MHIYDKNHLQYSEFDIFHSDLATIMRKINRAQWSWITISFQQAHFNVRMAYDVLSTTCDVHVCTAVNTQRIHTVKLAVRCSLYTVTTTYTKETVCILYYVLFWLQTLLYAYKYIESAVIRHTDPTGVKHVLQHSTHSHHSISNSKLVCVSLLFQWRHKHFVCTFRRAHSASNTKCRFL